jgi:hypothetical protein
MEKATSTVTRAIPRRHWRLWCWSVGPIICATCFSELPDICVLPPMALGARRSDVPLLVFKGGRQAGRGRHGDRNRERNWIDAIDAGIAV